jgi:hypothetical protein
MPAIDSNTMIYCLLFLLELAILKGLENPLKNLKELKNGIQISCKKKKRGGGCSKNDSLYLMPYISF